ncbi:MAG: hypothetical protein KC549_12875 [Myxococcales bacterium]|nr:hypothetical protein [Myxococcales bacterium]
MRYTPLFFVIGAVNLGGCDAQRPDDDGAGGYGGFSDNSGWYDDDGFGGQAAQGGGGQGAVVVGFFKIGPVLQRHVSQQPHILIAANLVIRLIRAKLVPQHAPGQADVAGLVKGQRRQVVLRQGIVDAAQVKPEVGVFRFCRQLILRAS